MSHNITRWPPSFANSIRGLRAARGTTLLAFAIFTLAIAAGTVTFSVVDTIAFRRLPYGEADRLIAIPRLDRLGGFSPAAPQDYFAWSGRLDAVEALGMYRNNIVQPLQRSGGASERLSVARVTQTSSTSCEFAPRPVDYSGQNMTSPAETQSSS